VAWEARFRVFLLLGSSVRPLRGPAAGRVIFFGPGLIAGDGAWGLRFRSQKTEFRGQKPEKGKGTVAKAASWDHDPSTDICPLTPGPHVPRLRCRDEISTDDQRLTTNDRSYMERSESREVFKPPSFLAF